VFDQAKTSLSVPSQNSTKKEFTQQVIPLHGTTQQKTYTKSYTQKHTLFKKSSKKKVYGQCMIAFNQFNVIARF
tara:strand:- start:74 stop:295 length:222 start_codon:yes stop_codon:yes gene_type:complete